MRRLILPVLIFFLALPSFIFAASSLSFSGGYVDFPDSDLPSTSSPRTLCFMIRTLSSSRQEIINYGTGASLAEQSFAVGYPSAGNLYLEQYDSDFSDSSAVDDGDVHTVCFANDGVDSFIYVDGDATASQEATLDTFLTGTALIGSRPASTFTFDGEIDNIAIWTSFLEAPDVTSYYSSICSYTAETNTADLYLPFDEGTGDEVTDQINSTVGTVIGSVTWGDDLAGCGDVGLPSFDSASLSDVSFALAIIIVLLFIMVLGFVFNITKKR